MKKIEEVLEIALKYVNENDMDYVLVGGIAVLIYGNPRTTVDIYIIIQLDEEGMKEIASYLREEGFFCDPRDMIEAFREKTHFSAEVKSSLFRLDIKGVYDSNAKITMKNRRKVEYEGLKMYVASPEDTIANKLLYGSDQDIEDAEGIYVRQKEKLDTEYLEERCKSMGVLERLEDLIGEVEKEIQV